jgi:hypothetical protein
MKLSKFREFFQSAFNPQTSTPIQAWSMSENDKLHVIAVYFNHHGFENPRKNFDNFVAHMEGMPNVVLHVVELVVRNMPFEVTNADNPHHTQVTTEVELFHKENLINMGVANLTKLYPEWKYVAWVDADIKFMNPSIIQDTIRACNRYSVVQMWAEVLDLDPTLKPLRFPHWKDGKAGEDVVVSSFGYCHVNGVSEQYKYTAAGTTWHPGYAWAMRRDIWDALGGLLDISILGAGDHQMAWAFVGKPNQGLHGEATDSFKDDCLAYLNNASSVVAGNLGYVDGMILHYWHGRKGDRKYVERWDILVGNKFDPKTDLVRRSDGLLQLTGNKPKLRSDIQTYFRQRNEDANTLK